MPPRVILITVTFIPSFVAERLSCNTDTPLELIELFVFRLLPVIENEPVIVAWFDVVVVRTSVILFVSVPVTAPTTAMSPVPLMLRLNVFPAAPATVVVFTTMKMLLTPLVVRLNWKVVVNLNVLAVVVLSCGPIVVSLAESKTPLPFVSLTSLTFVRFASVALPITETLTVVILNPSPNAVKFSRMTDVSVPIDTVELTRLVPVTVRFPNIVDAVDAAPVRFSVTLTPVVLPIVLTSPVPFRLSIIVLAMVVDALPTSTTANKL